MEPMALNSTADHRSRRQQADNLSFLATHVYAVIVTPVAAPFAIV